MCFHPFFFSGFWVFAILFLILSFRRGMWHRHWWRNGSCYGTPFEKSPENILAERFAKGEIDEREYNERLAVLKNRSRS
jgi:putative membrane protein